LGFQYVAQSLDLELTSNLLESRMQRIVHLWDEQKSNKRKNLSSGWGYRLMLDASAPSSWSMLHARHTGQRIQPPNKMRLGSKIEGQVAEVNRGEGGPHENCEFKGAWPLH
jgi:uncharacterized protein YpbB